MIGSDDRKIDLLSGAFLALAAIWSANMLIDLGAGAHGMFCRQYGWLPLL